MGNQDLRGTSASSLRLLRREAFVKLEHRGRLFQITVEVSRQHLVLALSLARDRRHPACGNHADRMPTIPDLPELPAWRRSAGFRRELLRNVIHRIGKTQP